MKTKRYIAYFLFFISMIMLTVPVIPHHHHEDGMICMKKRPAVRRVLPPSRRLQRTLLLRYRLHDHPFLPTDPQSEQQRHTALLRMGNHPICGTSSQTPDPARRNRHKARVYLHGISAWHVHHTCHRTSRAPFRSCLTHIAERNSFPGRRIYATWLHATFSNFVFQ